MFDQVIPFHIDVPETELDDLRDRLRRTRWPERETVADWSQGVPLAYIQDVCTHWAEKYDWRATEARLNSYPQFKTALRGVKGGVGEDGADRGLGIHFLH